MSQQELFDMQRTQQSVGYIQRVVARGEITSEIGAGLILKARTRIDPIQARLRQQQANLEQQKSN